MVKPSPWGASAGEGAASSSTVRTAASASAPPTSPPPSAGERAEAWERRRILAQTGLRLVRDRADDIRTSPRMTGKWGYVFSALGGVIVFILMFKHWMVAHGPDGMAGATPFGQIDSTTRYLTVWSAKGPPAAADLTGSWAVAASSMIVLTIAAVAIHIATNSERFARIATGGAVISALLVIANMLYLTARQKDLKNMTIRRWDLGGQVGSWINWAVNDGSKPVAGLNQVEYVASGTITNAAIAAVIIAVGSAVIAVATLPRNATGGRMPWRVSISREASASYLAPGAEQPADGRPASTVETAVASPTEVIPDAAGPDPAPPPGAGSADGPDTTTGDAGPSKH
ncbi:hypothetical protein [Nocardia jinanensis]|uniref:Uncharacterized protein n=1 Tax=Nocardia jinanensis TaxID=382504 RepID=A0A917VLI2_9NOCA|nr:hypothetical protein [Nocardia jinanensis]GGK97342.1 hypothetical protein GCM10011588_09730 [Nocardia jinanensis]